MRTNRELNTLFNEPNILDILKSQKTREASHVLDSREPNHRHRYEMEIK